MTRSVSSVILAVSLAIAACGPGPDDAATDSAPDQEAGSESAVSADRPDATAPDGENLSVPASWSFRPDRPDRPHVVGSDSTADVFFVHMTPGWHVTTGPAGIFYHAGSIGSGAYRVESEFHLFDPGERREAFGLFVGGSDLDGDAQAYLYFLVRQGGEFLVKERVGDSTNVLIEWAANDSINSYSEGSGSSVLNVLSVNVTADNVSFGVNGTEVASLAPDGLRTDGLIGFRVNHGLNLHISSLDVMEH